MKLESYAPDWYYITLDISVMNSIDKYLPEFLYIYITTAAGNYITHSVLMD